MELQKKIDIVRNEMLKRFPGCPHTIMILLWDDGTDSVQCRFGSGETNKIYNATLYNGELTFDESPMVTNRIKVDEFGKQFYVADCECSKLETI